MILQFPRRSPLSVGSAQPCPKAARGHPHHDPIVLKAIMRDDKAGAAMADDRPDPYELLRRSGYRMTLREKAAWFIADCLRYPVLALVCACLGALVGLLAVAVPAIIIAWVVS